MKEVVWHSLHNPNLESLPPTPLLLEQKFDLWLGGGPWSHIKGNMVLISDQRVRDCVPECVSCRSFWLPLCTSNILNTRWTTSPLSELLRLAPCVLLKSQGLRSIPLSSESTDCPTRSTRIYCKIICPAMRTTPQGLSHLAQQDLQRTHCSSGPEKSRESLNTLIYVSVFGRLFWLHFWFFDSRATDPLIHYGRHFGRTIHALCNVHALINNGIIQMGERSEEPEEAFTAQYDILYFYSVHLF